MVGTYEEQDYLGQLIGSHGNEPEDVAAIMQGISDYMSGSLGTATEPFGELAGTAFEPFTVTPETAGDYGLELDEGCTMEVSPAPESDRGLTTTLVFADGWRITDTGEYVSPDGDSFSWDEIEAGLNFQEAVDRVFPGVGIEDVYTGFEEDSQEWLGKIHEMGRTPDTEAVLRGMGMPDEDIDRFFTDPQAWTVTPESQWHIGSWGIPTWLQAGAQTVLHYAGEYVFKPIERYWPSGLGLQLGISLEILKYRQRHGTVTQADYDYYAKIDRIRNEVGELRLIFSAEAQEAYEEWNGISGWTKFGIAAANPVWWIPIAGTAMFVARRVSSLAPALTKTAMGTARAVQICERGAALPLTIPLKGLGLPFKLAKKVLGGGAVTEGVAANLGKALPNPKYVYTKIPNYKSWAATTFKWRPAVGLVKLSAKMPVVGRMVHAGRLWDPRLMVAARLWPARMNLEAAKYSMYWSEIRSMGKSTANVLTSHLRAIDMNPVRLFGINERGITRYGKHIISVLENPAAKGLSRTERLYASKMHAIFEEIAELMRLHGIKVPERRFDGFRQYIHRVVTGQIGAEQLQASGIKIGKVPGGLKARRFETVEEALRAGVLYARNPEALLYGYIDDAFRAIADKKLAQAIKKLPGVEAPRGAAQVTQFRSAMRVAASGGKVDEATLKAIEKNFGDLGARFKRAATGPTDAEWDLMKALQRSEAEITKLEKVLAEREAEIARRIPEVPRAPAAAPEPIPEVKLKQAFEVMNYQDRLAFRNTIETQRVDIQRMVVEVEAEIGGIAEFLSTDVVAQYRGQMGKLTTGLTSLLTRGGDWPESITFKQAELLGMGKKTWSPTSLTKDGKRIRWEYAMDELAGFFNMSEDDLVKAIQNLRRLKLRREDLREMLAGTEDRIGELNRMGKILDGVDADYANIPKAPEILTAKEPWQMTRDEWLRQPHNPRDARFIGDQFHHDYIKEALSEGKPVPTEVLKDYPDLAKAIPTPEAGQPEAGLQRGMLGFDKEIRPVGKGEVTQIGMDDFDKLVKLRAAAGMDGLPPGAFVDDAGKAWKTKFNVPEAPTQSERMAQLAKIEARLDEMLTMGGPALGETKLAMPAFRGWVMPNDVANTINYFGASKSNIFLRTASDVSGILRVLKATADFSVMFIQLLPALGHSIVSLNPGYMIKWFEAFTMQFAVWFRPEIYANWVVKHSRSIQQRISYGGTMSIADWFEAMPQLTKIMGHLPGGETFIRQSFGRFEQSFAFALDYMRQAAWDSLAVKAVAKGEGFALAEFCDHLIGVVSTERMGIPLWFRNMEAGFFFFAPRYTRGCLKLVGDIFSGGFTSKQALKALGGMATAGVGVYIAVCKQMGQEPNLSPTSSRFLSVKIGDDWIGIGSIWYSMTRLAMNVYSASTSTNYREPLDLLKIMKQGGMNRDNPWLMFLFSRSSPLTGAIVDMVEHRDFLGRELEDPVSYLKYAADLFTPIAMSNLTDAVFWDEQMPGGVRMVGEILGLRSRPESRREHFFDEALKYIAQIPADELSEEQLRLRAEDNLHWRDLDIFQQAQLRLRYPDLAEIEEEATEDNLRWATPLYKQWWSSLEMIREDRLESQDAAWHDMISGVISIRDYRDRIDEINGDYGAKYSAIANDPQYAEIYDEFDKWDRAEDVHAVTNAYYEYMAVIVGGDWSDEHGFHADLYGKAVDDFRQKWGEDIYNKILTVLESKKMEQSDGAVAFWKDKREYLDAYWDILYPDNKRTGESEEAAEQYRRDNTDVDARLFMWGYVDSPLTEEAYNKALARAKELGIPSQSITEGLPRPSLLEDMFAYSALPIAGYDRKWFLMEHRQYYDEYYIGEQGHKPVDFAGIPTREEYPLIESYWNASAGDDRLKLRCQSEALDKALVRINGYTPAYGTDRCKDF